MQTQSYAPDLRWMQASCEIECAIRAYFGRETTKRRPALARNLESPLGPSLNLDATNGPPKIQTSTQHAAEVRPYHLCLSSHHSPFKLGESAKGLESPPNNHKSKLRYGIQPILG